MVLTGPEAKRLLNEQFARLAAALAHPGRLDLLDLLAQGERTVEALAELSGLGTGNTSAQLQVLRRARLVETRKDGRHVHYRLAGDEVVSLVGLLRELARARLGEVEQVLRDYFAERDALEPVSRSDLAHRLREGDVIVLDVRPSEEYAAGHIPGAVSVPLTDLDTPRLVALHGDREIVAYCRGPYCVLASEAVARLREAGFRARRLDGGLPEWRLEGRSVVAGADWSAA